MTNTEILMKSVHNITTRNITLRKKRKNEVSSQYHYSQYHFKKEKKKYDVRQRRFTSEDLRPVGGDDYEF